MSMVIDLGVDQRALRKIQREARKWWPREFFAAMLGTNTTKGPKVLDIWVPEDIDDYTQNTFIYLPEHWWTPANEFAEEKGMDIVGSVHSHPYTFKECGGKFVGCAEPAPSSGDWKTSWSNICGIASVVELKNGKLRTRVRFYGPAIAVRTSIIVKAA